VSRHQLRVVSLFGGNFTEFLPKVSLEFVTFFVHLEEGKGKSKEKACVCARDNGLNFAIT